MFLYMSLEAKCYNSHSFITVSLLSAFNTVHNFDIICISEPYLISQKFSNDDKLSIPGYHMFRADHPSDNRCGGVSVYYKESLPIRLYNITYLQECICFNLMISNKLCNIVSLYRSPSQNRDEFENFIKGATKLYFTHYSCVVFILINTGLCKSAFSTDFFGKLVFYRFALFVFSACFVSNLT